MGGSSSKKSTRPPHRVKAQGLPTGVPPQTPYAGYPINYHYVTTNASMEIAHNLSMTRPNINIQSTSVDSIYPNLAAMYSQGYRMLLFAILPDSTRNGGLTSFGLVHVTVKFQGIFRALLPDEQGEQWELKVIRSKITSKMFSEWRGSMFLSMQSHHGSTTDSYPVIQAINSISLSGGRLINVQLTGMAGQELKAQQDMYGNRPHHFWQSSYAPSIEVSVDVFHEMPRQPSSERYVYQVVMCPMVSQFQYMSPQGRFVSRLDWTSVMSQYLGAGWRLVDIFEDHSISSLGNSHAYQMDITLTKNCLFIFEKPQSRLHDNTPLYEGTMVEHYITSKTNIKGMGFGGVNTTVQTNWEPVINHMGSYGWQVIRILDTPDTHMQGMMSLTMSTRQMIFFQRRIANNWQAGCHVAPPGGAPQYNPSSGGAAPPSYEQAVEATK